MILIPSSLIPVVTSYIQEKTNVLEENNGNLSEIERIYPKDFLKSFNNNIILYYIIRFTSLCKNFKHLNFWIVKWI